MAPISLIPGRIRFETKDFLEFNSSTKELAEQIKRIDGIVSVSINERTSRILIEFDDSKLTAESVGQIILENKGYLTSLPYEQIKNERRKSIKKSVFSVLKKDLARIAVHTIVPKPFSEIVPMVYKVINR